MGQRAKQKVEKMAVKSGKIMKNEKDVESGRKDVESGRKDVESGRSATPSQNAKFSYLRFFTWLYCTLIAVFGGFWLAQPGPVVPGVLSFFTDFKLSFWGFIPACLGFFGLGGARSLISSDKKDILWSIKMFKYFFDWIATLTGGLIIMDLIVSIIVFFSGPIGSIGFTDWLRYSVYFFFGMMIFRTGILFAAWTGYWMLGKVHKEAIARE